MSLKDMAIGIGEDARKANEGTRGAKVAYFRLKDGETARVLFLGDPVTFYQHNDYNAGIKSHACIDPTGTNGTCPSCHRGVKRSKKTVVAIWNIDAKELQFAVFNRKEMQTYFTHVDNYGTEEPAFIAVSGKGTDKTTTIGPVPPKKKVTTGEMNVPDEALENAGDEETILRAMFVLPPDKIERLLNNEPLSDKANADAKANEGVAPVTEGNKNEDDVPF